MSTSLQAVFDWKIQDFKKLDFAPGIANLSPEFSAFDRKWQMSIETYGGSSSDSLAIYLTVLDKDFGLVNPQFAIISPESAIVYLAYVNIDTYQPKKGKWFGKHQFIARHSIISGPPYLSAQDVLHIRCTLPLKFDMIPVREITNLQKRIGRLLESGKHSDITFVVEKTVIGAHRCILSAASPTFDAMFSHDMKENLEGVVNLEDISETTFKHVLHFIYNDVLDSSVSVDVVCDILAAADRFQITELYQECSDKLVGGISVENALQLFALAHKLNLESLRVKVLEWICVDKQRVASLMDRAEFSQLNPQQMQQILGQMVGKRPNKRPLDSVTEPVAAKKSRGLDDD